MGMYSIGNGETKELIFVTHGQTKMWGLPQRMGGAEWKGKTWDNCNIIINKI